LAKDIEMCELEIHRTVKESEAEFLQMQEQYKKDPTPQLKFDLSLKYLEVKLFQAKVRNMRRDAKK
jgi:hypothetical protein